MRNSPARSLAPCALILALMLACGAPLLALPAPAEAADAPLPAGIVPPQAIAQPRPPQPKGREGEGWVLVRFSVLADGHTGDVRAVEAMPAGFATEAAIAAVKRWTYKPATRGGKPIAWFDNQALVTFDNPGRGRLDASKAFITQYRIAAALVDKKNYTAAKPKIEQLVKQAKTLYEIDLSQVQLCRTLAGLGDYQEAYNAILRVTRPELDILSRQQQGVALQYRFAVEVELGLYPEALRTLARMEKIAPVKPSSPVGEQAEAVRQELAQGAALAIQGRIENGTWTHAPTRRRFTVANIQGRIDTVDVECNLRKGQMAFRTSRTWTLPPSWGNCTLDFHGENGTRFTVLEYKLSDAAGDVAPQ